VSPLDILRQLSAALPDQITVDLDEWTFDTETIRMRGTTSSFDAAETIKTTAAQLGLFQEVQLKDVKTIASGKKVSFGLQMTLGQEGR
jgi:general secretion pathway protein L